MSPNKKNDARMLDQTTLEVMRLLPIEATQARMKATDLTRAYGEHRRTVFRWLAEYYKGDEQARKDKPIRGGLPKLAEPQMQSLAQAVTDQTPLQHGYEAGIWTLSILLPRLMVGTTNLVLVVVDGHPVHKSALVRQYVERQAGMLQLSILPPYSPQLNPNEQVRVYVKRRVSSQFLNSKDEMKRQALGASRRTQKMPSLASSFFGHNECLCAWMLQLFL